MCACVPQSGPCLQDPFLKEPQADENGVKMKLYYHPPKDPRINVPLIDALLAMGCKPLFVMKIVTPHGSSEVELCPSGVSFRLEKASQFPEKQPSARPRYVRSPLHHISQSVDVCVREC